MTHIDRSVRRPPQIAAFGVFVSIQLMGGFAGLGVWSVLSQTASRDVVEFGARVLTVGMVIYLPLTLGLPFVLANYFRETPEGSDQRAKAAFAIRTLIAVATTTLVLSVLAAVALARVVGPSADIVAPSLGFAAVVAMSVMLQQIARIQMRFGLMLVSSCYNVLLPGLVIASTRWEGSDRALLMTTSGGLVFYGVILTALLSMVLIGIQKDAPADRTNPARSVLRVSTPLVPHLLAFGVLTQGIRLFAAWSDSEASVLSAHFIMLFIGMALAVITGINSFLVVAIQKASDADLSQIIRRYALAYGVLGALGSAGLAIAYGSPARSLFDGARQLSLLELAALGSVASAFCVYFLISAVLIRMERTWFLPLVTVPAALVLLGVAAINQVLQDSTPGALAAYVASLLAADVLMVAVLSRVTPTYARLIWPVLIAFVPSTLIVLYTFVTG